MTNKAIVLVSGGIDSCVALAMAQAENKRCIALSFYYQQRHKIELEYAARIAKYYAIDHYTITIDPILYQQASSSLTDTTQPFIQIQPSAQTPVTYVPGRNLLFLAHAVSFAEIHDANEIYFAINAHDIHNYPDCTPAFTRSLEQTINIGTPKSITIQTPLKELSKAAIIEKGQYLQAPLHITWSCYNPVDNKPCKQCDACMLRSNASLTQPVDKH